MDASLPKPNKLPGLSPKVNHISVNLCLDAENPILIGWNWGKVESDQPSFVNTNGKLFLQGMSQIPGIIRSRLEIAIGGNVSVAYTSKKIYGLDEPLIWELKLFGECARHSFFLESILPAMEKAGYTSTSEFNGRNNLWGHFDVTDVYCAHGHTWESVVKNGQLDTIYEPSPSQWIEGLGKKKEITSIWNKVVSLFFYTPTFILYFTFTSPSLRTVTSNLIGNRSRVQRFRGSEVSVQDSPKI